jgi:hypothetical protein
VLALADPALEPCGSERPLSWLSRGGSDLLRLVSRNNRTPRLVALAQRGRSVRCRVAFVLATTEQHVRCDNLLCPPHMSHVAASVGLWCDTAEKREDHGC